MHVFNVFNAKVILKPYRMMHVQNDFERFYRNEVPPAYQSKQVIIKILIRMRSDLYLKSRLV